MLIKAALDQLPPEVKEETFREKWQRREELLSEGSTDGKVGSRIEDEATQMK